MPQGWDTDRLKDRVRFAYGESLAAEQRVPGEVQVFGSNGNVGYHHSAITDAPAIIIGRKGSHGKVTWCAERCFPIDTTYFVDRTQTRENLRWLYYALNDLELDGVNFDSAVPGLSRESAYSLPVVYPPPLDQGLVSAFLDGGSAIIDAAVNRKRQQLVSLGRLRAFAIQRAVTRGLIDESLSPTGVVWIPELPASWRVASLKRIAAIQTGLTLGKDYDGPLVERPYLRVANVQDGRLALDDVTLIEVPESVARGITLRSGDVLMTEGGDLDKLGRGTVWNDEIPNCMHQNHVFAIRCFRHKLLPQFLAYLTASPYGRGYFEATGKKTTNLASTNATKVGLFPIPLPPVGEQVAICEYLDGKLSDLARLASTIEAQIDTLTAYRKSLIHECVTGQRRITEADLNRLQAHAPTTSA